MLNTSPGVLDLRKTREHRADIEDFHIAYCHALDSADLMRWPDFFTEDAIYRVTARENADAGLPLGLVYAEGRGMLRDRAVAILRTQMFAPRHMMHIVGNVMVLDATPDLIHAQSNYLLLQTLVDGPTTIHQSGRYHDTFVREDGRLLLANRQCVYDTTLIANDLVYPV